MLKLIRKFFKKSSEQSARKLLRSTSRVVHL